ncbi:MAG TPA: histidine kinase, partial [Verrucomicrobia bacterium]|nr:histidine kinase [Verrucomicrobiota bacterium]
EVSDTGCGMDTQTIARIFEPFFTTKFTGRGLGLSAVMGIVRAHEGALRVYSEPGKGTTFKVMFPVVEEAKEKQDEEGVSTHWRGSGTVLLVDDEETIRAIGSKQLRHLGLDVLTAEDGRQAVAIYRERRADIDLVLLDLIMPHMNGEEAYRELRQIAPDVRVILASGYSESDIASRFAGKGLAGCLQKPYTLTNLRSLLSTLLPSRVAGESFL